VKHDETTHSVKVEIQTTAKLGCYDVCHVYDVFLQISVMYVTLFRSDFCHVCGGGAGSGCNFLPDILQHYLSGRVSQKGNHVLSEASY
jgi:hypothetical protein